MDTNETERAEDRESIVRYLRRIARTEVGTILSPRDREVVGWCAAWVENQLDRRADGEDGDPVAPDGALARWGRECAEWAEIRDEMATSRGGPVTAHQVTTEQRKRMLARGDRPVSIEDMERENGGAP